MANIHENDAQKLRAKINAKEMEAIRELLFRIIDRGAFGADVTDEIEHFLAALSVADRNSVCRVSNFIADGRQSEVEADCTEGDPKLLLSWDLLLERLIPWLENRGYQKHGIHWHQSLSFLNEL